MLRQLLTSREIRLAQFMLPVRNYEKLEAAKAYLGEKWLLHPANKIERRTDAARKKADS